MQSLPSFLNQGPIAAGITNPSANVNQIVAGTDTSVSNNGTGIVLIGDTSTLNTISFRGNTTANVLNLSAGGLTTTSAVLSNNSNIATTAYADRNFYLPTVAGFREDFLSSAGSQAITTAASVQCDTNWNGIQISGGTQVPKPGDSTFANPGVLTILTSSGTANQGFALYKANVSVFGNLVAQAGWDIHIVTQLSRTSGNAAIRVGVCKPGQQVIDPPTDGFYVEYDANNSNSSANYVYTTANTSVYTYNNTNTIAINTGFHHFRIRSTAAGTVLFSTDGGTETSMSANLTTSLMVPFVQVIARNTATFTANLDYFSAALQTTRT